MPVALLARETDFSGKLAAELPDNRAFLRCLRWDSVAGTFNGIRSELGDPETVVYNAGSGIWVRRRSTARGDSDMILLGNRNAVANLVVKNLDAASLSTCERAWFMDQLGGARRMKRPEGALPDVRDGLTREERVVLHVLREIQAERNDRNVPTAML
jgi:hypothetical protein